MPTHRSGRKGGAHPQKHTHTHKGVYSTGECIRQGKLDYTHTGRERAASTEGLFTCLEHQPLQVSTSPRYCLIVTCHHRILMIVPPFPAIFIIPDQFPTSNKLLPAHYLIRLLPRWPAGKIRATEGRRRREEMNCNKRTKCFASSSNGQRPPDPIRDFI